MTSFVLYTVFINLLIAVLLSFFSHFILGKATSGGYWFSTVIALLGAYIGTFIGIFLQVIEVNIAQIVVQFILPILSAFVFLILFIIFDHYNHQG